MSDNTVVLHDKGVEVRCKTVYGAEYVKKVTHPPSDARFEGTPSKASPNVTIFEITAETNVPVTFQVIKDAPVSIQDINASAILFLTPSGGKVGSYVFYRTATNTWAQQAWLNAPSGNPEPKAICACRNDAYNWQDQYAQDFAASRQAYKSTTFYLNATKNNNQGVVTTAKFKPSIIGSYEQLGQAFNLNVGNLEGPITYQGLVKLHTNLGQKQTVQQLQTMFEGDNIKTRRPQVTDDLDEDGYQVLTPKSSKVAGPAPDFRVQLFNLGTMTNTGYSTPGKDQSVWVTNVLPNDATQLLNLSRKAASRLAQEGAFVVQGDSDDVNLFQPVPAVGPEGANLTTAKGLYQTAFCYFDPNINPSSGGSVGYVKLLDAPIKSGVESFRYSDIPWNMSDWSWTLFDGLSTTNADAWGLPYITVKTVTGWEAQPRNKSFASLVQRLLPLPDPDALEMAAGIHAQRPDSLPASANDLGSIASTVLQFLPTAVGWLKDLFGSKPKQDQAMQKAQEFVRPTKQPKPRKNKPVPVNKIANAVAKKLEHDQPYGWEVKGKRKEYRRPRSQSAPRLPTIVANKNPGEMYQKPTTRRRSISRQRSQSKKRVM